METEQRRELMQTCETWLSSQLPTACLERRDYEDAVTPTHLLLVEQWLDEGAMNSYLSSERFRALIGTHRRDSLLELAQGVLEAALLHRGQARADRPVEPGSTTRRERCPTRKKRPR